MRALRAGLIAALPAALLAILISHPVGAQEGGRAALVIMTGTGDPITRCVAFEGESVSGYDLLAASGLAVSSEQAAMGATICSLEGVGCAFPADSCFCQCQGSPCIYWSYWQQDANGVWLYANAGAGNTRVRDGAVEGWVWGPGTVAEAQEPPALTFGDICAAPVERAAPPVPATVSLPEETETAIATSTGALPADSTSPEATQAPPPVALQRGVGIELRMVGLLALIVLAPLGALVILRRRR